MKRTSASALSRKLGISPARGIEAAMKAQLIDAVLKTIDHVLRLVEAAGWNDIKLFFTYIQLSI